jgi:serine/threonine protein kinase
VIDTILNNRYQICERLSRKAGRSTFLALDLHSQSSVIVKIVRFDPDFQWDDIKLFEREATTLQNLDHPSIPKYLDYFEVTDGFALVQAYIDAPSLEMLIKAGRKFSEDEVIELADRLLSILTYLHDRLPPLIHRDLKPSNILLNNRSGHSIGDVYLVDFGSVQTAASVEGSSITIVGSYGYMPAEQFYGQTTIASDLYSLGMTLIYLVQGIHPAELPSINGRVKFERANLSNKFFRWLEKMTEYAVDRRFDSTQSAQAALTSSDGSYGDFLNLRPADSQVMLYRDCDRLEIKLLQVATCHVEENFISTCLFSLSGIGCLGSFLSFIVLIFAWSDMSWSLRLSWMMIFPTTIFLIIIWSVYISKKTHIGYQAVEIDRKSKKMKTGTHDLKNRQAHWSKEVNNLPIDLLIYCPSYSFDSYFDEASSKNKSAQIKTEPKLSICMGKHEYLIADNSLSEAELHWLGRELSDFLDLELQIVYPNPTLRAPPATPPPSCSSCASCGCC